MPVVTKNGFHVSLKFADNRWIAWFCDENGANYRAFSRRKAEDALNELKNHLPAVVFSAISEEVAKNCDTSATQKRKPVKKKLDIGPLPIVGLPPYDVAPKYRVGVQAGPFLVTGIQENVVLHGTKHKKVYLISCVRCNSTYVRSAAQLGVALSQLWCQECIPNGKQCETIRQKATFSREAIAAAHINPCAAVGVLERKSKW